MLKFEELKEIAKLRFEYRKSLLELQHEQNLKELEKQRELEIIKQGVKITATPQDQRQLNFDNSFDYLKDRKSMSEIE